MKSAVEGSPAKTHHAATDVSTAKTTLHPANVPSTRAAKPTRLHFVRPSDHNPRPFAGRRHEENACKVDCD